MTRFYLAIILACGLTGLSASTSIADFWADPAGSGTTCSLAAPCTATTLIDKVYTNSGTQGWLLSGIYTASAGGLLSIQNRNVNCVNLLRCRISAVIDGGATFNGQNTGVPGDLFNSKYWTIQGMNFKNSITDVLKIRGADLSAPTLKSFIEVKRVIAYHSGAASTDNRHCITVHNIGNVLLEDVAGFGRCRKVMGTFDAADVTWRRGFAIWNQYDGDHQPHPAWDLVYNSHRNRFENIIGMVNNLHSETATIFNGTAPAHSAGGVLNTGCPGSGCYLTRTGQPAGLSYATGMILQDSIFLALSGTNQTDVDSLVSMPTSTGNNSTPTCTSGEACTTGNTMNNVVALAETAIKPFDLTDSMTGTGATDSATNLTSISSVSSTFGGNWNPCVNCTSSATVGSFNLYATKASGAEVYFRRVDGVKTTTPWFPWDFDQRIYDAMVDAGTAEVGPPIHVNTLISSKFGAFPAFGFSSATINENFLDVTLNMNNNVPVLPATGITGFTVNNGRTVTSAAKLTGTDSVVRLTISGAACIGGQTWTVTYTPGNVTDSLGQPLSAFSGQAVSNNCGTAPPPPPGTPLISYTFSEGTGTTVANAGSGGATYNGTLVGGAQWGTGHNGGFAVHGTDQVNDAVTTGYGSGVNPSTQALTICMGVLPDPGLESSPRLFFGAPIGTNQRLYLGFVSTTWSMGIHASGIVGNNDFPVQAGWTRICVRLDSGTATLFKNGVKGTGPQSVKTYTSYTLAGNLEIGHVPGAGDFQDPGATIDDVQIFPSALSDAEILADSAAWAPAPPPPACTFSQAGARFYGADYVNGVPVPLAALNTAISLRAGTSFAVVTQTDCTVGGPSSIGNRLRYSRNGGPFMDVPDVMGTDQIAYIGSGAGVNTLTGAISCCLSGALTPIDGLTQTNMGATPIVDYTLNSSAMHRRILTLGASAVPTDTYKFEEYNQTGAVFSSYTPSGGALLTVAAVIAAPTALHVVGPNSNTNIDIIWAPVADSNLAGYRIYQKLSGGSYGNPVATNTPALAAATHSSITQWRTVVPAGDYCFVVTAIDIGGVESAASNETCVTRTGMGVRIPRTP